MAISDLQINTWTNQGGTTQSAQTYSAIQDALTSWQGWSAGVSKEIYLQGSYGNSTNIHGNSDVDVVVELTSAFKYNLERLSEDEKTRWRNDHPNNATYGLDEFRTQVFNALSFKFPGQVKWGNKCINIGSEGQRLNADVVPAIQYKEYRSYSSTFSSTHFKGIKFRTTNAPVREIVNFPKLHLENGQDKNSAVRTNGNFKPLVRAFKNARDYLISQRLLRDGITPSYFLESLVYNIPDSILKSGITDGFRSGAIHLLKADQEGSLERFICQNGAVRLFGSTEEQWDHSLAREYITALVKAL